MRSARDRRGRQASMIAALVAMFVPRQSGRIAVAADQQERVSHDRLLGVMREETDAPDTD